MTRAVKAPEGTYAALQATVEGGRQRGDVWVAVTPTQVRRPWRATVRTVFQFALALATLLPFIASGIYRDVEQAPAMVTQLLAAVATFTRVMALSQVEVFLQDWLPWLAAAPPQTPKHLRQSIRGSAEVSDREPDPGFVGQSMSLRSYDEGDVGRGGGGDRPGPYDD